MGGGGGGSQTLPNLGTGQVTFNLFGCIESYRIYKVNRCWARVFSPY